jgi:hypothetical protein
VTDRTWTEADVRALGVRCDLVTACAVVYGCGRTKAYELLHTNELDFPVLKAGARYVVAVAHLLRLLGLSAEETTTGPAAMGPVDAMSATEEDTSYGQQHRPADRQRAHLSA